MLILFLAVVLADEHGSLASLHERLVEAGRGDEQHWAHGRDVKSLQNSTTKLVGKSAYRPPRWELIVVFLQLQLPPEHLPLILGVAAGLYRHAYDLPGPPPDYTGPFYLPEWARHTRTTPEMISDDLQKRLAPPVQEPAGEPAAPEIPADLDVTELVADLRRYRQLLPFVLRGIRELDLEVGRQRERADYAEIALQLQQQQFVEFHQLKHDYRELQRQHEKLQNLYAKHLMRELPGSSRASVQQVIDDQLSVTNRVPVPRPVWEFTESDGKGGELAEDASSAS
ncbi:hypothetical protein OHS18_13210 [Amycolatopsis sp. NBC_00355]|uniref:hypothetical protein n=1 Tax=Amycolatopsis sp. NBC_00355 TaxID=2975957 RepID=UPI002E271F54